jgi:uridine kinase
MDFEHLRETSEHQMFILLIAGYPGSGKTTQTTEVFVNISSKESQGKSGTDGWFSFDQNVEEHNRRAPFTLDA